MTRDQILNMPAGRELDALIAERVFGLEKISLEEASCPYCHFEMRFCGERSRCTNCNEWRYSPYKEYSSEIEQAFGVVDFLKDKQYQSPFDISKTKYTTAKFFRLEYWENDWIAKFQGPIPNNNGGMCVAHGDTPELAICRAALLTTLPAEENQ